MGDPLKMKTKAKVTLILLLIIMKVKEHFVWSYTKWLPLKQQLMVLHEVVAKPDDSCSLNNNSLHLDNNNLYFSIFAIFQFFKSCIEYKGGIFIFVMELFIANLLQASI